VPVAAAAAPAPPIVVAGDSDGTAARAAVAPPVVVAGASGAWRRRAPRHQPHRWRLPEQRPARLLRPCRHCRWWTPEPVRTAGADATTAAIPDDTAAGRAW